MSHIKSYTEFINESRNNLPDIIYVGEYSMLVYVKVWDKTNKTKYRRSYRRGIN